MVDIAVGTMHCLALTDDGKVYGWGKNDYQQVGESSITWSVPTLINVFEGKKIAGIACGPTQVSVFVIDIL